MGPIYFTVTGVNFRFGDPKEYAEKGTVLQLVKEPDNEFDSEAKKIYFDMGSVLADFNENKKRICQFTSDNIP